MTMKRYVEVIWHYRPYSLIKHMYFTSISRILLYPEDACFRSCMHEVLDYNVWEVYRCVFQHFVTLWFCVHFQFTYWFDDLQSMDESLLYRPLLSIPSSGVIPGGPKSKCAMQVSDVINNYIKPTIYMYKTYISILYLFDIVCPPKKNKEFK